MKSTQYKNMSHTSRSTNGINNMSNISLRKTRNRKISKFYK